MWVRVRDRVRDRVGVRGVDERMLFHTARFRVVIFLFCLEFSAAVEVFDGVDRVGVEPQRYEIAKQQ